MTDLRDAADDVRKHHAANEWDVCVACREEWPCAAELLAEAALRASAPGDETP